MPIYEYTCTKCGREFEDLVFGDQDPPCPDCGSPDTKKLMSRCSHTGGSSDGYDAGASAPASGCGGCAGGHCATCGH
ncbi:MAG: zinc ribbon domain-containing protein [Desulfovibrio sp.]|jgi:putative FmdB family regulatory protein|nr:zinc ribbon domain-containing protein [Desulfovibrio sp.]